jgi:hypothetical protein
MQKSEKRDTYQFAIHEVVEEIAGDPTFGGIIQ